MASGNMRAAEAGGGMGAAGGRGSVSGDGLVQANPVGKFDVGQWWSQFQKKFTGKNWAATWRDSETRYYRNIEQGAAGWTREFGNTDEFYRNLCRQDLYFLGKEVLGYKDMAYRLHFPLSVLAGEARVKHKLALFPRKHFKTTVCTISSAIQSLLRDPEIAILMGTGTAKLVREVTHEVKQHFMVNRQFRALFPEFVPQQREWGTLDQFTVPGRKLIRKEPTWQAASTGTSLTGGSYDMFYADDLIDMDDVNTRDLLAATEQWVGMVRFILKYQEETPQMWSGTRYHFSDIYSHKLAGDDVTKGGRFVVWVRRAIEDGESIFGERPGCRMSDYQRTLTTGTPVEKAVFAAQMMQNPVPVGEAIAREAIQYHNDGDEETKAGHVYINCDTAASKKESADFHGFVVWLCTWGVGPSGNPRKEMHALEAYQKRVDQFGFWAEVYRLFLKYGDIGSPVLGVTLQKEVIENVYMSSYEKAREEQGVPLPLIEARIHKLDKQKRISRLLPWLKDGSAKLRRGQTEFEDQLVFGEKASHDDIADPASDIVEVATWPEREAGPVKVRKEWRGFSEGEAWAALEKQVADAEAKIEEMESRTVEEEELVGVE